MNTNKPGREPEPTDAGTRNCPDCGAMPGQYHMDGCDVERCPECGGQQIGCDCDLPGPHRALPWTGEWPGKAEAREFGWFSRFVDGLGWVRCSKDGAGASPDLNRLVSEAVWDADAGRFVLSGARPMPESGVSRAEMLKAATDTLLKAEAERMPDTPAPDEQDATLVKLIDLLTRTANAVKGQPGEMKQHGWADLPELCTALTARVAGLEAALRMFLEAGLGNSTDVVQQRAAVFNAAKLLTAPTHTAPGGEGGGK